VAPQCDIPGRQIRSRPHGSSRSGKRYRAPGTQKHLVHMIFGLITGPGHPVAVHVQLASVPANRDLRPDHSSADRRRQPAAAVIVREPASATLPRSPRHDDRTKRSRPMGRLVLHMSMNSPIRLYRVRGAR
jgi:hypothetical protein